MQTQSRTPRRCDYIWTFLQDEGVSPYFLFCTFSLHPIKDKIGWSIDAKLRVPLPIEFENVLWSILPFRKRKDKSDGCWVIYWKGLNPVEQG